MYLLILRIKFLKLRIHHQRLIKRNVQFLRNHLRNTVYECIWEIHNSSHITDNTFRRHRTKRNDLYDPIGSIFADYIIDYFLTSLETEIHVNIGHGYSLRIQETFKQKLILDRINTGNLQTICNNTSGRRTSSRSNHDIMLSRIMNKVPHDQEIVHISHILNRRQLIIQTFSQRAIRIRIASCKPFIAQFIQIFP